MKIHASIPELLVIDVSQSLDREKWRSDGLIPSPTTASKYVFRGDSSTGWIVLQAKDAKVGPLVVCEPNMGWQRPNDDVPLSAMDAVEIELALM